MATTFSPHSDVDVDAFSRMEQKLNINPVWLANSRLRRRRFEEAVDTCSQILQDNPYDKDGLLEVHAWVLILQSNNWVNDMEVDDEAAGDILLDENAIATIARPGTSLNRPLTQQSSTGLQMQTYRPVSSSGRPVTGMLRPGTGTRPTSSSRPGSQQNRQQTARQKVQQALQGGVPGSSRPLTQQGRLIRLGTASMAASGEQDFINVEKLNLQKYAKDDHFSRVLCDYLINCSRNYRKALELGGYATQQFSYSDWWWKAQLGKCFYHLGLYRDAEKQLKSSLKHQYTTSAVMQLGRVYNRLDQPTTALDIFREAQTVLSSNTSIMLGEARILDSIGDMDTAVVQYKQILQIEPACVEAIACLATHCFYNGQPEQALTYFRRILQLGVSSCELWNNLGLCCLHSSQFDMAVGCYQKALFLADDTTASDIWYNIGHLGVSIGDLTMAHQAFTVAVSLNPNNCEALINLGVLESRAGNTEEARLTYQSSLSISEAHYEAHFNLALLAYNRADMQESYRCVQKALDTFPGHPESVELKKILREQLNCL